MEKHESIRKQSERGFLRRALPVAAALVLAAGGLWVGGQDFSAGNTAPRAAVSSSASRSGKSASQSGAMMSVEEASYDSAPMANASYSMTATAGSSASTADGGAAIPTQDSRKLVYTADIVIRTSAFEKDLEAIREMIGDLGGYVESSYQSGDADSGDTRTASLSLRVPAAGLDAFLNGVSGVGRVVSRAESSTDMTIQYADNQARLNTLRQKLTRLNELLTKAESVADIVEIENAIADAQYMIDSYETTQRSIDRRVDMSEVSLTLREDNPMEVTSDMSMGERLKAALAASLEGLGRFFRNVLVFIVMALPVIVPLAAIILLARLWVRRTKTRKEVSEGPESPKDHQDTEEES